MVDRRTRVFALRKFYRVSAVPCTWQRFRTVRIARTAGLLSYDGLRRRTQAGKAETSLGSLDLFPVKSRPTSMFAVVCVVAATPVRDIASPPIVLASPPTVLVTGATGRTGLELYKQLKNDSRVGEVRALVRGGYARLCAILSNPARIF